jgi:hypothetical protein
MEAVSIGAGLLELITFEDEICVLGSVLGIKFRDFFLTFKVFMLPFS